MKNKEVKSLLSRYIILLLLAVANLYLFYKIFTPLTLYPVAWFLKIFYNGFLLPGTSTIFVSGLYIELIPACIAGAAYYLLLMLNLTTPMPNKTRAKSIIFLMISFLMLNILRIVIFSYLAVNSYQYFDLTHKLVWYFGSTALVVIIWFANVYIFRISSIPVYTDIINIIADIKKKSKRKK